MPGRFNRRRGRASRGPVLVSNVLPSMMPSGVNACEFEHVFSQVAPAAIRVFSNTEGAPSRCTSLTATIASSSPMTWKIRAFDYSNNPVFESRTFTTCGNSVDINVRCPKSTDFGNTTTSGPYWQIEKVVGVASNSTIAGVARFSYRGAAGTSVTAIQLPSD